MEKKIVIIGGVAGGATAAARLRRLDEHASITVFEKGGFVSFANCGLPYYIGGSIKERAALTLQTPESFRRRFNVDVRVCHEVTEIDRAAKTVTVKDLNGGAVFKQSYDKLIIATGAKATVPPFPGADGDKVFTLRSMEDTFALDDFISAHSPKHAVVIGGGFIGIETAENLIERGIAVTLIQQTDHLLPNIDADMAGFVHSEMRGNGIALMLSATCTCIEENADGTLNIITDKGTVAADMAVMAAGVTPDTALAKAAGLALGIRGSIKTDDHMLTSDKDIYAVGDAVEVTHFISRAPSLIALAGPANKQGRIAADNICGIPSVYRGTQGASILKIFSQTYASTGMTEEMLRAEGTEYGKVILFSASHATYYPGASNMTLKVIFSPEDGSLFGAQIIGREGVDKRLDVIAAAIKLGAKASDLAELELCYAPPYSSAKDPVNMAGFAIGNIIGGRIKQFYAEDADAVAAREDVTMLDVRTPAEYSRGSIANTVNIPVDVLREHLGEIPKDKPVYVNCQSGLRSYIACMILSGHGYDCYNLAGGYRLYASMKADGVRESACHPCGIPIK